MARQVILTPKVVRGIRTSLDSGFMLGRISPGTGPVEMISIDAMSIQQKKTGLFPSSGKLTLDIGIFLAGAGTIYNAQYYPMAMAPKALSFPSGNAAMVASCQTAPTNSTVKFYVTKSLSGYQTNGPTDVNTLCMITFAAAATVGVFTQMNAITVARGDVLYLVVDGGWTDVTIADIQIVVTGDPA